MKKLSQILKKLENKFEFTNNTLVFIKDELKKSKDDTVAKNFIKEIKNINTQGRDKADVLKELFLKRMKDSKVLKSVYNREAMNNAVKLYAGRPESGNLPKLLNGFKTAKSTYDICFDIQIRFACYCNTYSKQIQRKI